MTYNGIGVQTPRGTGTSGYVVNSHAQYTKVVSVAPVDRKYKFRTSNALQEYENKRKIETQVYSFRKKLASEGKTADEIEASCKQLREQLMNAPIPNRKTARMPQKISYEEIPEQKPQNSLENTEQLEQESNTKNEEPQSAEKPHEELVTNTEEHEKIQNLNS